MGLKFIIDERPGLILPGSEQFGRTLQELRAGLIQEGNFVLQQNFDAAFQAEYQAILDYATGQGYALPSGAQQIVQNQLVIDLKTSGIWYLLDVFYNFYTNGDVNFASINWKNPGTHQATRSDVIFSSNSGFVKGSNGILTSGVLTTWNPFTHGLNAVQADVSFGGYASTIGINVNYDLIVMGPSGSFDRNMISRFGSSYNCMAANPEVAINNGLVKDANKLHHLSRFGTSLKYFKNGTQAGSTLTSNLNRPFVAGNGLSGLRPNGQGNPEGATLLMLFAGASLTGLESNFSTAWNTYKTNA